MTSDTPEIEPALDAEDWRDQLESGEPFDRFESRWAQQLSAHQAAALALHEQPFGFTWEDVEALRSMEDHPELRAWQSGMCTDLANRIAALLPPRSEE